MKIISGRRNASYTFDADNRLVSLTIIQPDTSTSTSYYLYDSSGQRIYSKDVTMSSAGAILETRETYTISKNYSETYVNGVLKTKNAHIFAGDLMLASVEYGGGSDAPLIKGELKGDLVIYHLSDHLGSTSVSTDTTGAIVELSDYFAYGSPRQSVQTNTSPEKRKYIGQEYDISTGLNYLNARYYNSAIGRFISQDSVFLDIGIDAKVFEKKYGKNLKLFLINPQVLNSFSYSQNNPISFSDPTGKFGELTATWGMTAWPVIAIDGPFPFGDTVYVAGIVATAVADVAIAFGDKLGATIDVIKKAIQGPKPTSNYQGQSPSENQNNNQNQKNNQNQNSSKKYKEPKSGVSGKEGSKDVPSWAKGQRPYTNESGKDFAKRVMDQKYGNGGWEQTSKEFSEIKKWGDRSFQNPGNAPNSN